MKRLCFIVALFAFIIFPSLSLTTSYNDGLLTHTAIVERIARLETRMDLKFEELDKALVLARELVETERVLAKGQTDVHFKAVNESQARMDKMSATFATKEWAEERLSSLEKLVYIGLGMVLLLEALLKFGWGIKK
jgi:hypothetical protein